MLGTVKPKEKYETCQTRSKCCVTVDNKSVSILSPLGKHRKRWTDPEFVFRLSKQMLSILGIFSVVLALKVFAFCGLTVANTQCAERMTLRVIRLEHA